MNIRPDMFEADEKLSAFDLHYAARRRERRVNLPIIMPIVLLLILVPFFGWLALDYAYGGALDMIDNPKIEGFN